MLKLSVGGYKGWCAQCVSPGLGEGFFPCHFGHYFGPDWPGLFLQWPPSQVLDYLFLFAVDLRIVCSSPMPHSRPPKSKALKEAWQIHHLEQGKDNRKGICMTIISLINGKYLLQTMGEFLELCDITGIAWVNFQF